MPSVTGTACSGSVVRRITLDPRRPRAGPTQRASRLPWLSTRLPYTEPLALPVRQGNTTTLRARVCARNSAAPDRRRPACSRLPRRACPNGPCPARGAPGPWRSPARDGRPERGSPARAGHRPVPPERRTRSSALHAPGWDVARPVRACGARAWAPARRRGGRASRLSRCAGHHGGTGGQGAGPAGENGKS